MTVDRNEIENVLLIVTPYENDRLEIKVSSYENETSGFRDYWVTLYFDKVLVTTLSSVEQAQAFVNMCSMFALDQIDLATACLPTVSEVENEIDNQVNLHRLGK